MGELARRLPDATRLIVPGAGHMVPITHPQAGGRGDLRAHLAQSLTSACDEQAEEAVHVGLGRGPRTDEAAGRPRRGAGIW